MYDIIVTIPSAISTQSLPFSLRRKNKETHFVCIYVYFIKSSMIYDVFKIEHS